MFFQLIVLVLLLTGIDSQEVEKKSQNVRNSVEKKALPLAKISNSSNSDLPPSCQIVATENDWTYLLRKIDNGPEDFNKTWTDYKNGFGSSDGELWLGLECLYQLTNAQDYELKVKLVSKYWGIHGPIYSYAAYKNFKIGSEAEGYPLKVLEGYSGSPRDSLAPLVNMKFTTCDKKQDRAKKNCACKTDGGWWFDACYARASFLTGSERIYWFGGQYSVHAKADMMVRPAVRAQQ